MATGSPPAELLRASRAELLPNTLLATRHDLAPLLVDAYAAQHHGEDSPQAVQSVAVHLLAMHGVLERGHAVERALWVRQRALRVRGVYRLLSPPPRASSLALRQLWTSDSEANTSVSAYVESVYAAWRDAHAVQLASWFADYVERDVVDVAKGPWR